MKSTFLIKVRQNGSRNAKAGIDVVASEYGINGALFFVAGKVVPEIVERDRILLRVHVVGRDPGEIVEAPVHQVPHIRPPVNCMHDHTDQMMMVTGTGDDLDKVGCTVIARLAAIDAGIPPEDLIAINQIMLWMRGCLWDNVYLSATDLMQKRQTHAIATEDSEITRAGVMIRSEQAMGIHIMGVQQAQLMGSLVHLGHKARKITCQGIGNGYGCIIA